MAIRATRGMIGATARSMIHIGVGAGALAGVVIRTILDIFHRTTITTTIHLTMAVVAIAVLLWHIVRIAQPQVEDLRILAAVIDLQHLSRV